MGSAKSRSGPALGVPRGIRAQFVAPAVTIFATMAFVGFYAALAPTLMKESLHEANLAIEGAVVSELFLVATATVVVSRKLGSRSAMLAGLALFPPSLALLVAAQALGSFTVLLAGTAIGGVASALGYRGSLQVVNQIAPADRRAETVSSYLVAAFIGNALPIIGVGFISARLGLTAASTTFACTIGAFGSRACGRSQIYAEDVTGAVVRVGLGEMCYSKGFRVRDAEMLEIADVARYDDQVVFFGGCGDHCIL